MSYLEKYDKYKTRYSALLQFGGEILLDISYDGVPVQPTMELSKVQNAPSIKILDKGLHTLLLVDPDASAGTWLHWMLINNTDQVVSYYPPTPPAGSGPHRYTFILYKQQGPLVGLTQRSSADRFPIRVEPVERGNFDAHSFAEKYNLQKIAKKVFIAEKI